MGVSAQIFYFLLPNYHTIIKRHFTTYSFFHKRAHSLKTTAISRTKGSSVGSAIALAPVPLTVQGLSDTTVEGNIPQADLFFVQNPLYQPGMFRIQGENFLSLFLRNIKVILFMFFFNIKTHLHFLPKCAMYHQFLKTSHI